GWAGAAIGAGAAAKFVPLAVLPALAIAILARNDAARARLRDTGRLVGGAGVTVILLIAPAVDGVRYVIQAQAARFASGLTFQQLWRAWAQQLPYQDWQPRWQLYASSLLGNLLLPLVLLAAIWLLARKPLPLRAAFVVLVLAFLAGSKLVNEAYALAPVALLTVELARRPSAALRGCRTLLWSLAFAYAAINTPLPAFFFSVVQQVQPAAAGSIQHWTDAYRVFLSYPESAWPYALYGLAFSLTATWTIWQIHRSSSAFKVPAVPQIGYA
ncbi:MAG: hypothetical protein KGJ86_15605, partial [Chloroflexota bacterium]|nr:hypothetical protein [Chloroflexota bacterium]